MPKKYWLPSTLLGLLAMFTNVKDKIGGYKSILPITGAQVDQIILICETYIAAYNYTEAVRASTSGLVDWRDNIFNGKKNAGDPAPAPPTFPTPPTMPSGAFIGIINEFKDLRELIVASPGYTDAIGEDLKIVGDEIGEVLESTIAPTLTVTTDKGYKINVAGSMQGMDAMRIEYQRNGSTAWNIAAFLTKTPGEFTITPATPGEPESGRIHAVFIKKNEEFGAFSPDYPVTIS